MAESQPSGVWSAQEVNHFQGSVQEVSVINLHKVDFLRYDVYKNRLHTDTTEYIIRRRCTLHDGKMTMTNRNCDSSWHNNRSKWQRVWANRYDKCRGHCRMYHGSAGWRSIRRAARRSCYYEACHTNSGQQVSNYHARWSCTCFNFEFNWTNVVLSYNWMFPPAIKMSHRRSD